MKKVINKNLVCGFVLGTIVFGMISISAASLYQANQIQYKDGNIDDALNNLYETSKQIDYSTYSDEEQIIGKWIDGRNVYRKYYYLETISTQYTYIDSADNIDILLRTYGSCYDSSDKAANTIPTVSPGNVAYNRSITISYAHTNGLIFAVGTNMISRTSKVHVFVEYVKKSE